MGEYKEVQVAILAVPRSVLTTEYWNDIAAIIEHPLTPLSVARTKAGEATARSSGVVTEAPIRTRRIFFRSLCDFCNKRRVDVYKLETEEWYVASG